MLCRIIINGKACCKTIDVSEAEVFNPALIGTVTTASLPFGYANIIEDVARTVDGADIHLKRIYLQGALN